MSGRIMALDVGDARIGVALSDPMRMFAQPHSTVERKGKQTARDILELVLSEQVTEIIVGMPYELDGTYGDQAKKVDSFINRLNTELIKDDTLSHVKISVLDERMTTNAAERVVVSSKLKGKEKSAALDRVSASLILETYLARNYPPAG